ncbi:MAG: endonuclease/exonuclease/phosphatase family protein [Pirellulales bacterium]
MRVFTYNIHKGIGGKDRRYRLERVIAVIEDQNPDLICLQEVARGARRSRFDDQPRLLADYLRTAECLYQNNVHYRYGGYGNLLLSRWPIGISHQISLRMGRKKPRGAQLAVVETPEGPLHLANWHLGLAEKERHWQAEHLLKHRLFRESSHLPTLVVGDTNDWRNTLAGNAFEENGFAQVTHPASRFRSFPAWMPVGSLDKFFLRGPIRVRGARVIRTAMARRASDHLPLVLDFHLET